MIDSHAHLTDKRLLPQADALVLNALRASVEKIVCICTDIETTKDALELQMRHKNEIYLVAGTTPHEAETLGDSQFSFFEGLALKGALVAVGESGLDYHYEHSPKEIQKKLLHRYLQLAKRAHLPIVIHCREAFQDLFEIIDQYDVKGVLHCFTGTLEEAKALIERGWLISFSGIITFKKSIDLQEVVKIVPLENMLIETDSPYLAPQTQRGKTNEPAFVVEVASKIAELKRVDAAIVREQTAFNTISFFNI